MSQLAHLARTGQTTRPRPAAATPRPEQTASPALLITVDEAARRLGIGRSLAYQLVANGRLRSIHIGRLRRVPADAVPAFVASLLAETAGAASDR